VCRWSGVVRGVGGLGAMLNDTNGRFISRENDRESILQSPGLSA